jgi:hypothetical protein
MSAVNDLELMRFLDQITARHDDHAEDLANPEKLDFDSCAVTLCSDITYGPDRDLLKSLTKHYQDEGFDTLAQIVGQIAEFLTVHDSKSLAENASSRISDFVYPVV